MSIILTVTAHDGSNTNITLPDPTVASALTVTLVVPSGNFAGTYVYNTQGGPNLNVETQQAFVDPGLPHANITSQFTEQRTLMVHSLLPLMQVRYTQDIAGSQNFKSVSLDWGNMTASTAVDLAAGYELTIAVNGNSVYSTTVAGHPWFTGYRVSSVGGGTWAPGTTRPITRTVAQLTAANLLPVFSSTNLVGSATPVPQAETYSILGLSGLTAAMGTTGDRYDIGFFHDWAAYYLVTGNGLGSVMAIAEAARSWNIVLRDPNTLAPMDCINTWTKASMVSGTPLIPTTNYKYPYGTGVGVAYEEGHSPNFSYLPFLLTGDPYYLENLQFQAVRDLLEVGYGYRYTQQGRYLAWPLRTILMAVLSTPSNAPNWLLNQAQITAVLDAYGASIATWTGSNASDL